MWYCDGQMPSQPGQAHVIITVENCAVADKLIYVKRHITKDEIANLVGISHSSVHTIIHEKFDCWKGCTRWVLDHPPYSPDLWPRDFHTFDEMKSIWKAKSFQWTQWWRLFASQFDFSPRPFMNKTSVALFHNGRRRSALPTRITNW